MGVDRGTGPVPLRGGRDAVDQHVVIEDSLLGGKGKLKVPGIARVHVKDRWKLGGLRVGDAMGVNIGVRLDALYGKVAVIRVAGNILQVTRPGILRQCQELRITGLAIGPEDGLDVGDVALGQTVICRIAEVVAMKRFSDVLRAGVCVSGRGETAEENILRPAMLVPFGIFKHLGPEIAVCLLVLQGVFQDGGHLLQQRLVPGHKSKASSPVDPVGLLLPRPPAIALF